MASYQLKSHMSTGVQQKPAEQLSDEVTAQLQHYLELCANLRIDFYDCLAHARIEYDKNRRH